ncbi:oligoendopeptidase F [Chitinimonas sp. BJYL2]|uniref:oligoendopeptidase F n=1 Tax=Chitinimonas sp. BJYL2 TaxID=2976696 RepID=UPI0022B3421A|nr:oligoendopeptidase F [Chitinimonas sp. BJYL2]
MSRALSALTACMLAVTTAYAANQPTPPAAAKSAETLNVATVWNLKDLYADDASWETERKAIAAELPALKAYKGTLGRDAAALLAALDFRSGIQKRLMRLYSYASMKSDEDTRVAENQARDQLATNLYNDYNEATAWIAPELNALGADKINGFLAAEPKLGVYRHTLMTTLRLAPHTLGQKEEAILAAANAPLQAASNIYGLLANADIPWPTITIEGKKVTLDQEGYVAYRDHRDPKVRKQVFDTFWKAFRVYERTFGATYTGHLQGTVFQAKARNHGSSLTAALSFDNTPESVYRTLVTETNAGLPTLHRYFKLRQKLLGLKDLRYSDIYVPLAKPPREYSLNEAAQLTLDGVKPLGEDYARELRAGFNGGWMHSLPQRGKRSGAYMNGSAYDVHPFVLMSYNGSYDSVSTLAHEWGHALHSVYSNRAQAYPNADYALFVAEIPSTTNEMLLADYMIANAKTRAEKIFAIGQQLETLRGTFFRQAMFAEFELLSHEAIERGDALTGDKLSAMYLDLLKRYHGHKEGVMKIEDAYGVEWAYIPHFYRDFYVFQYATSISAAAYFAEGIAKGDLAMRDRYFEMISAGGSADPYEIVKKAGLDMAKPDPYRAIIKRMDRLMDQMDAVLASK